MIKWGTGFATYDGLPVFSILHFQFFIPSSLPLLVRRVLAADDPDDAAPLDDLAAVAALLN
jgi:hypothetical protein